MKLGSMHRRSSGDKDLNLSPLIDIIFILLIFFIVTTTFKKDLKLTIEKPQASKAKQIEKQPVRIVVTADQKIYLQGQPIYLWTMGTKIKEILSVFPDREFIVASDSSVPAGKLVEIIDQCKLAGVGKVGVSVEKKN